MSGDGSRGSADRAGAIRFGRFRLERDAERLWRDDDRIRLQPRVWLLLLYLIDHPHRVVTKEELLDAVWPDEAVSESSLSAAVSKLRAALGESSAAPQFLKTLHRRGFEWIASLERDPATQPIPEGLRSRASFEPPVARASETAELVNAYERAQSGTRQLVFVEAEAGLGKSHLIDAFVRDLPGNVLVALARCVESAGLSEPYLPILDAISRLAPRSGGRVAGVFRRCAPDWLAQLPWLVSEPEVGQLHEEKSAERTRPVSLQLATAVAELGREEPFVFVLEDLHWSDAPTLALLRQLVDRDDGAALLLIASYRPSFAVALDHPVRRLARDLQIQDHVARLRLHALDRAAVEEILRQRRVEHVSSVALAEPLTEVSEGNPLYLLIMLEHLLERGWLARGEEDLSLTRPVETIDWETLPGTLRDCIQVQLETLTDDVLRVLEAASAIGFEFSVPVLASALDQGEAEIEAVVESVVARSLFVREADEVVVADDASPVVEYAFGHALYRRVLYDGATAARRRRLHRRIGERLERMYASNTSRIAGELAEHFAAGGDHRRAAEHAHRAAANAVWRTALPDALALFEAALANVLQVKASEERATLELRVRLGMVGTQFALGKSDPANVERFEELALELDPSTVGFGFLEALYRIHAAARNTSSRRAVAVRMLEVAEALGDPRRKMVALWSIGSVEQSDGDAEQANAYLDRAAGILETEPPPPADQPSAGRAWRDRSLWVRRTRVNALALVGRFADVGTEADAILRLVDREAQIGTAVAALLPCALWLLEAGHTGQGHEFARRGRALALDADIGPHRAAFDLLHWAHDIDGDGVVGPEAVQRAWDVLRPMHFLPFPIGHLLYLQGCLRHRLFSEGLQAVDQTAGLVDHAGWSAPMVEWLRGEFVLAGREGSNADARLAFERAADAAQSRRARLPELWALASWVRSAPEDAVARTRLEQACQSVQRPAGAEPPALIAADAALRA